MSVLCERWTYLIKQVWGSWTKFMIAIREVFPLLVLPPSTMKYIMLDLMGEDAFEWQKSGSIEERDIHYCKMMFHPTGNANELSLIKIVRYWIISSVCLKMHTNPGNYGWRIDKDISSRIKDIDPEHFR